MAMTHTPAGPLPVPPDFPVRWENPEEERYFFTREHMHFPHPVPPLEAAVLLLLDQGFNAAAADYEMPIRAVTRRINTYIYQSFVPLRLPPEELAALGQRAEAKIGAIISRLGDYWETELLPEVRRHLDYWTAADLTGASNADLIVHLDDTLARTARLWEIHFRLAVPMLMSMGLFDELYHDLFGADDAFGSQRLLQGLENKTVEGGQALWRLSRLALASSTVRRVLEEQAAAAVIPALEATAEGRAFLAELRGFLADYGQRGNSALTVAEPSWIEDPTPVIKNLKDY